MSILHRKKKSVKQKPIAQISTVASPFAAKSVTKPVVKKLGKTTGEIFGDMFAGDSETFEKILVNMVTDDENISMKTRIPNPLALSQLETIRTWYEMELGEDSKSVKVLDIFIHDFRVNRVSLDGKSREELIRALSAGMEQERTITDKLSKPPSD
jgi:hypothetical protein